MQISWSLIHTRYAPWTFAVLLVALVLCTVTDLRHRKVGNNVTFPAALLGMALHGALGGGWLLASSVLAFLLCFTVGLLLWSRWSQSLGAGDVKMVMATAALLGFWPAFFVYFLSNLAMVVYLFLRWIVQGSLLPNLRGIGTWLMSIFAPGTRIVHFEPVGMKDNTPHAPFMLLGAIGTLTLSHFGVLPW